MTDLSYWTEPRPAGGAPCSTRSRHAGESLAATASYGRRWLLLEVAGGWGPHAFRDSSVLDRPLGTRIERRAAAEGHATGRHPPPWPRPAAERAALAVGTGRQYARDTRAWPGAKPGSRSTI